MKNYIITSDKYSFLLEGYTKLYNKYWHDITNENVVLGFDVPPVTLPHNFRFHSLGAQKNFVSWTEPLIKFFETIEDRYFLLCFEDHYILKKADAERLQEGLDYMEEGGVDKLYLQPDYGSRITGPYKGNWFVSDTRPGALTTTSLLPCVWRKEYFLKLLYLAHDDGCPTPHHFEILNNRRSFQENVILLTKDTTIYANLDAVRKGSFNDAVFRNYVKNRSGGDRVWMQNLDPEDIKVYYSMREKWNNR
jgi:hypothetical protein